MIFNYFMCNEPMLLWKTGTTTTLDQHLNKVMCQMVATATLDQHLNKVMCQMVATGSRLQHAREY
jgi:hypothetical protein